MFLLQLINWYSMIVLAAVVVSWIQLPRNNPVVRFLDLATEPLLTPIRRVLPGAGGLDFSPLVLILGLRVLSGLLAGLIL